MVCQTWPITHTQAAGNTRPAQVRVNQQCSLTGIAGNSDRQISGYSSLPLTPAGAGDHYRIKLLRASLLQQLGTYNIEGIPQFLRCMCSQKPPLLHSMKACLLNGCLLITDRNINTGLLMVFPGGRSVFLSSLRRALKPKGVLFRTFQRSILSIDSTLRHFGLLKSLHDFTHRLSSLKTTLLY